MDRRGFLRSIGLGIGGIALEQAIPLGRVWSFPKKIIVPVPGQLFLFGGARGGGKLDLYRTIGYIPYFSTSLPLEWHGLKRHPA